MVKKIIAAIAKVAKVNVIYKMYICDCGKEYNYALKERYLRSKYHIKRMQIKESYFGNLFIKLPTYKWRIN